MDTKLTQTERDAFDRACGDGRTLSQLGAMEKKLRHGFPLDIRDQRYLYEVAWGFDPPLDCRTRCEACGGDGYIYREG